MTIFWDRTARDERRESTPDYLIPDSWGGGLELVVQVTSPSGERMDITERVADQLSEISEASEEDLLQITHGDISLEVADDDGAFERFVGGAQPGEEWVFTIERETGERRPKYERVFGGVLDVPWSLQFDRADKTAKVQVFTFSKVLEFYSADDIKRSITGVTGTCTAAGTTCTVNSTTNLLAGDMIQLDDGTEVEENIILAVVSATSLKMKESWNNSFTDALLTLATPYYRFKTPEFIADALFDKAGISYDLHNFPTLPNPAPTGMNTEGLPTQVSDLPISMTVEAGKVSVTFKAGASSTGRKVATSPVTGFTAGSGATTVQGDWTPYKATEPGTIITAPNTILAGRDIEQTFAWDYVHGDYYHLVSVAGATSFLYVYKNNVNVETFDSFVEGNPAAQGYVAYIEHNPDTDELYVSYQRINGTGDGVKYRASTGGAWSTVAGLVGAQRMRFVLGLGLVHLNSSTNQMDIIDSTAHLVIAKKFDYPPSSPDTPTVQTVHVGVWSLRMVEGFLYAVYRQKDNWTSRVVVWDVDSGNILSTFAVRINGVETWRAVLATVYTWADGSKSYLIAIGPDTGSVYEYYAIGKRLIAIPYANLEGQSVGEGLKNLAIISVCTVNVDEYRIGHLRMRENPSPGDNYVELPEPSEQETSAVFDFYRSSAEVSGTSETGENVSVISGDRGDSSHRLSVDSSLINSLSMAEAVGNSYVAYLGRARKQEEVTVAELGTIIRPFDIVLFGGVFYQVTHASLDLIDREQELRLVEI